MRYGKRICWVLLGICLCSIHCTAGDSLAETVIPAGSVSGTWMAASSPYVVQGDIEISTGETLVIEAGVTVRFEASADLKTWGTLTAVGTTDQPITFTSASASPAPGDWQGIQFFKGSSASELSYCTVTYATNGIYVYAYSSGCTGHTVAPDILHCEIAYNSVAGVYAKGSGDSGSGCTVPRSGVASPRVEDCEIHDNGTYGIYVRANNGYMSNGGSGAPVAGNYIHSNTLHGIYIAGTGYTSPTITENQIIGNGGAGIYCTSEKGTPKVTYNEIAQNAGNGIYNRHDAMSINSNRITENGDCGIDTTELASLEGNDIFNNTNYGLTYSGTAELAATDNYWGTSAPSTQISGEGPVTYEPYRSTTDSSPPTVSAVYPANGAANVATGAFIRIVFSEEIDEATVTSQTILLDSGGSSVSGSVSYGHRTAWFIPSAPLELNTTYSVTVTTAIQDMHFERNHMAAPYTRTFSTRPACGDYCSGRTVSSVYAPLSYLRGLASDGTDLWCGSSSSGTMFRLISGGAAGDEITLPGSSPRGLAFDGTYFWCDDSSEKKIYKLGSAGNVIATLDIPGASTSGLAFDGTDLLNASDTEDKIFRTDTAGNISDEYYLPHSPADLAFDGTHIWYSNFRRVCKMDLSGNVTDSFSLDNTIGGLAFDGAFLWAGEYKYSGGKIYKIAVDTGDTQPPTVVSVTPQNSGTDINAGVAITATFSEEVDERTLTSATVVVNDGAADISGTIEYDDKTVRFIPSGFLAYDTTYTVSLTNGVKDNAGNSLSEYTWTFTTGSDCGDDCPGQVLASFDAPDDYSKDIAYGGGHLWVAIWDSTDITQMTPSGEIVTSLDTTIAYCDISGLAHDGTDLWASDWDNKKIFRIDTAGNILDEFAMPTGLTPQGMAFDGTNVWINASGYIYCMDKSGNFISAIKSPASRGLAFDGTYFWVADSFKDKIYQVDTAGQIVKALASPGPAPEGLAFDGKYLWCLDSDDDTIYKMAITELAGELALMPSQGFAASGTVGGPFSPVKTSYTVKNTGDALIEWSASENAGWLDLNLTGGTLDAGESAVVRVALNSSADALPVGNYSTTVQFRNITNGVGNSARNASLSVNLCDTAQKGDVNGDDQVDLRDAIISLQTVAGADTGSSVRSDYQICSPDVNGDAQVGLEEAVYVLRSVAD